MALLKSCSRLGCILPLAAGMALAQAPPPNQQEADPNQWTGTLMDANCYATHTQQTQRQADGKPVTVTDNKVVCPVTAQTNSFGLMTSEGQFIRFDDPSNTRVLDIIRTDDKLGKGEVHILGKSQGGVAVVESMTPGAAIGTADRLAPVTDVGFDVDHEGDKGKLIVTATGIQWENVNRADRSDKWTFAEIKEFRKDGKDQIELEPFKGKRYEFDVIGDRDAVYQAIADRIAAARPRQ